MTVSSNFRNAVITAQIGSYGYNYVYMYMYIKVLAVNLEKKVYFIHLYRISHSSLDNLSTIRQCKLLSEFELDSPNSLLTREKLKLQYKYNASWLSDPQKNFQFSLNM